LDLSWRLPAKSVLGSARLMCLTTCQDSQKVLAYRGLVGLRRLSPTCDTTGHQPPGRSL